VFTVLAINTAVCKTLNGKQRFLVSKVKRPDLDADDDGGGDDYENNDDGDDQKKDGMKRRSRGSKGVELEKEHWMFVNGVAVGTHWLQSNIDRLALTFGREITGVHNPTAGIIFDIIQCLIQRCFCYATADIRDAYLLVKEALLNPDFDKIVLILHSQGAIEGGLIVDWLLDELPQAAMRKLEVYTFGAAANHFNNPRTIQHITALSNSDFSMVGGEGEGEGHTSVSQIAHADRVSNAIRHIEHYANTRDFVSVWGVLNFIHVPNRFMGRLFVRDGAGHQLNQHYLDNMFPIGPDGKVIENNDFMETVVDLPSSSSDTSGLSSEHDGGKGNDDKQPHTESLACSLLCGGEDGRDVDNISMIVDGNHAIEVVSPTDSQTNKADGTRNDFLAKRQFKVKEFSRLWQYRNGQSPENHYY